MRVVLVDGRPQRHLLLQPVHRRGQQQLRVDAELVAQLALPLRRQLRRAQHRQPVRVPGGEQLGGDQPGLDRLADPDAVGDQQPGGVLGQRHHQRHQLVVAGGDADGGERAERAAGGAKRQPQRVAQQPCPARVAAVVDAGRAEHGRARSVDFGQQHGGFVVTAAQRPGQQQPVGGAGQHQPVAAAGVDQGAGGVVGDGHAPDLPGPNTSALCGDGPQPARRRRRRGGTAAPASRPRRPVSSAPVRPYPAGGRCRGRGRR